ncbi:hypothetical protein PTKIN_Ptkin16aG0063600 [Pterospermum kingtungense]
MKRSPPTSSSSNSSSVSPSSSSPSSSSSSSSSLPEKPKAAKRVRIRKNQNSDDQKCSFNNINANANSNSPNNSARRSSIYRGVTRHRWTGRFEAHLWDKSSWNNQNKKGRQGAYDSEEAAARTYDLAALKYWGPETILNFPIDRYEKEIEEMNKVSKEEYLASLRRRSSGFSRGVSKYRGVARHHHNGRWEARIGRVFGNKYLYLGTYNTQEEAAAAYDMAALEYRGTNAVTNFDVSHYIERLKQKGIIFLDQTQERIPDSDEAQRAEAEAEHLQPQQEEAVEADKPNQFQYLQMQLPQCGDNATMSDMETTNSNELAWSFCMDSGLTSFLVPDFPIERTGELPNLFDHDKGFEDNIDMIFDESNRECVSDDASCGGVEEVGVSMSNMVEENGKERLLSSDSESPYSSTTSVSCNYV